MLVETNTTLALFCPHCGKLMYHDISLFQFSGCNSVSIYCDCGEIKTTIVSKKHKQYLLHIDCLVCETKHIIPFPGSQFWSSQLTSINCTDVTIDLGFVGPRHLIEEAASKCRHEIQDIVCELGFDDYFVNPEIMYEVLNEIHDIAEKGDLLCQCGSAKIGVDILPDELELKCGACRGVLHLPAKDEEDLMTLRSTERVIVPEKRRCKKR